MALNAIIGALRIVLGADATELETGLKKGESALSKFARRASEIAAGIQLQKVMERVAHEFTYALKQGFAEADKMGKMAQSIGIPIEELSKMRLAADLSGISMETLSKSVGILSKNMASAAMDFKGKGATAFEQIGVKATDAAGKLRPTADIMGDVAEKFSKMQDGATKTAIALMLFGRGGAAMIPMLNMGREGFRTMGVEAEKLGLIISTKTFQASEALNDNLKRLTLTKQGIANVFASKVAPMLAAMTEHFVKIVMEGNYVERIGLSIAAAFEVLARAALLVYDNSKMLVEIFIILVASKVAAMALGAGIAFVKFAAAIRVATLATLALNAAKTLSIAKLAAFGGLVAWATGNFDVMKEKLSELGGVIANLLPTDVSDKIKKMLDGAGIDTTALTRDLSIFTNTAGNAAKAMENVALKVKGGLDQIANSTKKQIEQMNALAATYGMAAGASTEYVKRMELEEIARQKFGPGWVKYKDQIAAVARDYANASVQADGFRLKMELRGPIQVMQDDLRNLDDMLKRGAISWEDYGEAVLRTRAKAASSMLAMASEAAGLFSTIFKDSKAAAIAQAVISAAEGVARSLGAYPWPFAGIMAALHAAAGAAQISRIRSVSQSSTSAAAAPAVTAPPMNEQTLRLQGMDKPWIQRDSVIELIGAINQTQKDGTKIKIIAT